MASASDVFLISIVFRQYVGTVDKIERGGRTRVCRAHNRSEQAPPHNVVEGGIKWSIVTLSTEVIFVQKKEKKLKARGLLLHHVEQLTIAYLGPKRKKRKREEREKEKKRKGEKEKKKKRKKLEKEKGDPQEKEK